MLSTQLQNNENGFYIYKDEKCMWEVCKTTAFQFLSNMQICDVLVSIIIVLLKLLNGWWQIPF